MEIYGEKFFLMIAEHKFKQGEPVENIPYIYEASATKEFRKEKGLYYTPYEICEFIVQNTIGEWIKHNGIDNLNECKILDPACGCGLFLLAAFDYIVEQLEKYKGTKLTVNEKKDILKNNLYGVDIDGTATEITKLLLLMKVYENARDLFFDEVVGSRKLV